MTWSRLTPELQWEHIVALAEICDKPGRFPHVYPQPPLPVRPGVYPLLEPISEPLSRRLLELKLCSTGDLRRCRRLVRRLTSDLPAFDSVWLDALVQAGQLTPYQARALESNAPERIQIGPCVAVSRLGSGLHSETLLARSRDDGELCVIKILRSPDQVTHDTYERLLRLTSGSAVGDQASIVVPNSCVRGAAELIIVSRYVAGPHLGELLVRRGRFPPSTVGEIARQLGEGLAELWREGLAHGDIRAGNVRLTRDGTAVLVDAGIRPAIAPQITIHTRLAPDQFDGIAPELIGASTLPSAASDAYALGCLLWQLLAGRPPFPGGDPLIKLAAHQTRTIEDVRKWAPEVPVPFADAIRRLTARDPADRPADRAALRALWGMPTRGGARGLAEFRRRFDEPARPVSRRRGLSTATRWLFLLASLFVLSGAVVSLSDRGARSVILGWLSEVARALPQEPSEKAAAGARQVTSQALPETVGQRDDVWDLPAPDRQGVIHLDRDGTYRPSEITRVGALAIVGGEGVAATIEIVDRPLKLCAESVTLRNVTISKGAADSAEQLPVKAVVLMQTQELTVEHCTLNSGFAPEPDEEASPDFAPPTGPALVAWRLLEPDDPRGGSATIHDSLLLGHGPAVYLGHAVRRIACENVLKIGPGPLVQLAAVSVGRKQVTVQLSRTTCRASGAVVRWVVPTADPPRGGVRVEALECVFDLVSPGAALFELAGPAPRNEWLGKLQMSGEGSVASPGLETAAWVSTEDGKLTPLDASALELEGLFAAPLRFAGALSAAPADSVIRESEAPRRSTEPPGIRTGGFRARAG